MVNGTPASSGQDRPAADSRSSGLPDSMAAYAHLRPFIFWAAETAHTMLGMQREMMDLTRGVFRQQQDTMIAAMFKDLAESRPRDIARSQNAQAQDGFAGLARLSLAAFDRMAAALRASNDAMRWTSTQASAPDRSAEPR